MHLSATARPDGLCFTRTHLHAANSRAVERRTDHRRRHKCKHITCDAAERSTAVGSGTPAAAAVPPTAAAPFSSLPFFPDRRCVEEVDVPPLATCHHYINMTNGIEVIPRLQALSLPYRFLRLPSTRCEQQQWEALMNDLDADLLMRLALGQCCLVYDLGSRNKKRGAPRAVWYGLEFVRYALRRLWLNECSTSYLRGYSVTKTFEQHVAGFSGATKKKLRYFARFIPPGGLPQLHLYGVYAATKNDGNKEMYAALLRSCEGGSAGADLAAAAAARDPGVASAPSSIVTAAQVQCILDAAAAHAGQFSEQQRHALLHGPDPHAAAEQLLGMRIFLGGVSHSQFHCWAAKTGYPVGRRSGSSGSSVEL